MAKTTRSVNLIVSVSKPYIKFTDLFSTQSDSTHYHEFHLWKAGVTEWKISHSYGCVPEVQRVIQHLKTWLLLSAVPLTSVYVVTLPQIFFDLLIIVVILERGQPCRSVVCALWLEHSNCLPAFQYLYIGWHWPVCKVKHYHIGETNSDKRTARRKATSK